MLFRSVLRRGLFAVLTVAAITLVMFLLNAAGWRARILARLFRVENWPVVVPPPTNFQPQVPPGFKVSVFAKGFTEPRWLAVASNGDVFVADSAAGAVVVLRDPHEKGSAESREIFALSGSPSTTITSTLPTQTKCFAFAMIPRHPGGSVTRSTSSTFPGWAITSTGRGRWPLVRMAQGCLFLLGQEQMFRSSAIAAVRPF
jgi:glucose/arabinose dehydrogenase